ncbi:MAG: class I SAM-dependent methyltransferase [Actinomycetota bacterium]|nr:class I SAM-dependent methyltransferase [Actinomycetota bacterium]
MLSSACRSCGNVGARTVVDLGLQPLSNAYLAADEVAEERVYPLHARFCRHCYLVQVDDVVAADDIFTDYAYFSSYSDSWVAHARQFAHEAAQRFALGPSSFVVEIASNDGYLLSHFQELGVPVLGIEPARNVAVVAIERGVPTDVRFFGLSTATDLVCRGMQADLIVANNVLAHVPDLNDFVRGLAKLLATAGSISIEVPHLLRLVQETQFDTIYHEHFSYFSLLAARQVLERHGLHIFDVQRLATHGGSLRIFAGHAASGRKVTERVEDILAEERAAGLDRYEGFAGFAGQVEACRDGLVRYLSAACRDGRKVVGYGAAAKGNTLLNYAGVGPQWLEYVADRSPHKQGRLLPGTHLPVVDPVQLDRDRPDDILILPWNLRDEIVDQLSRARGWGARFVTAVPAIEVIG